MSTGLSEQEQIRRNSLQKLRELGIDPYPAAQYHVNATTTEILENFNEEKKNFNEVILAGRLMSHRIMGKASFAEIQDHMGRIQIYVNRDELCPVMTKPCITRYLKNCWILETLLELKDLYSERKWVKYLFMLRS